MADLRPYVSSGPLSLARTFLRDLLAGIAALDAVGGDLVVASGPLLPPVVLVRHPDVLRELLVDRNADSPRPAACGSPAYPG